MWYNRTNLSNTSVGIEVVGYHDKKPTAKQLAALKTLIAYLRTKYRLSEDKVVTHSMVAYDTPNQWYSKSHRGRKRCGMLFATKGRAHGHGPRQHVLFRSGRERAPPDRCGFVSGKRAVPQSGVSG